MIVKHFILIALFSIGLVSCQHPEDPPFVPKIQLQSSLNFVEKLPPAFEPLTDSEKRTPWGQEFVCATGFSKQYDFYRAITCYKKALFLLAEDVKNSSIQQHIEYDILLAYFLSNHYNEVAETFDSSSLREVSSKTFKPYKQLLCQMIDTYYRRGQAQKTYTLMSLLQTESPLLAYKMRQYQNFMGFQLDELVKENTSILTQTPSRESEIAFYQEVRPYAENILAFSKFYEFHKKSEKKAEVLNALLPGAGYMYVGQPKSAVTSLLLNALFIASTWQFFERGYVPFGIITGGLEIGWYVGGIRGAGLAARKYNEELYQHSARECMAKNKIFPIFMIEYGF